MLFCRSCGSDCVSIFFLWIWYLIWVERIGVVRGMGVVLNMSEGTWVNVRGWRGIFLIVFSFCFCILGWERCFRDIYIYKSGGFRVLFSFFYFKLVFVLGDGGEVSFKLYSLGLVLVGRGCSELVFSF